MIGSDNMKNVLKNPILMFILGFMIASSIGAYATIKMQASEVKYKNQNVETALNYVYANLDTKKILNSFGSPIYATSQGERIKPRTVTMQIPKGKYIVFDYKGHNWRINTTTYPSDYNPNPNNSGYKNLACESNNCVINNLSSYYNRVLPAADASNYYNQMLAQAFIYFVEIKEDTDTLSASENDASNASIYSQFDTLIAIPIN